MRPDDDDQMLIETVLAGVESEPIGVTKLARQIWIALLKLYQKSIGSGGLRANPASKEKVKAAKAAVISKVIINYLSAAVVADPCRAASSRTAASARAKRSCLAMGVAA